MTTMAGMEGANGLVDGPGMRNGNGNGPPNDPESFDLNLKTDFLGPVTGLQNGSEKMLESRELMVDWKGRPADKHTTGTWKAAWHLNFLSVGDSLAVAAIGLNLVTYMTTELHQSVAKASVYTNQFLGASFLFPIFWGFIADSYLGKYWTITLSFLIYVSGLAVLTYAAESDSLQPPACVPTLTSACPPAGNKIMTPVIIALYVISIGSGGTKPTTSAMGADQFDDTEPVERAQGGKFFVWYFLGLQLALLIATSLMVYISTSVSFGTGYGVALGIVGLCMCVFILGTAKYRHKPPSGSPLTRMAQVIVAAVRKWNLPVPEDKSLLYESTSELSDIKGTRKLKHSPVLTFLDKAAVMKAGEFGNADDPWKLCTVTQVEELKRIVGTLPIWLTTCLVYISYAQISSFTIAQGFTMDRHMGPNFEIPPVCLGVFGVIITVLSIPFYNKILMPVARRYTGHESGITPLQRIGTGMFMVIIAYLVAAGVESQRLAEIRDLGFENSPVGTFVLSMKVYWLIPVYAILAVVEVFTTIGQLEFFYAESTDSTRSLGTSFFFTSISLGYFLATAVVDAVESSTSGHAQGGWLSGRLNNGGLKSYFFLLAIIMTVDFVGFLGFAHMYKYKKLSTGEVDESRVHLELSSQTKE